MYLLFHFQFRAYLDESFFPFFFLFFLGLSFPHWVIWDPTRAWFKCAFAHMPDAVFKSVMVLSF
jgi:hypothetical protein